MRWGSVAFAALALCACGDKKATQKAVSAAVALAPTVSAASAVSTMKGAPPLVVMIAGPDSYRLATAASWDTLARRELAKGPVQVHPTQVIAVFPRALEDFALERSPEENLTDAGEMALLDLDEEPACKDGVDTHGARHGRGDDPPPPEEDDPDRGAAIDPGLGKMGQPDTDRDIAQYKMRKDTPNASERVLATAERNLSGYPGTGPVTWRCLDSLKPGVRRAQARGDIDAEGMPHARPTVLILVEPNATAGLLVDAVELSRGGAIGVAYEGQIRPLAMRFDAPEDQDDVQPPAWLEVRVLPGGLEIGGPGVSASKAVADSKALVAALEEVRHRDMLSSLAPVDVLVAADVNAQRLVDVLVALIDGKKTGVIGLGHVPK
jgi:hypothetical protein